MECLSYCIANSIDLSRLDTYFKTSLPGYSSLRTRDVLKINRADTSNTLIFVFKNGTVVSWGVKRHQVKNYLNIINQFADRPVSF